MGMINTGDANKAQFRLLLEGSHTYGQVRRLVELRKELSLMHNNRLKSS